VRRREKGKGRGGGGERESGEGSIVVRRGVGWAGTRFLGEALSIRNWRTLWMVEEREKKRPKKDGGKRCEKEGWSEERLMRRKKWKSRDNPEYSSEMLGKA